VPEYVQRADLWPLDPDGDLLALMMIESAEGLKNINDIAAVPGVAGFYVGDNDLSNSLGVALGSPESEAAIDTIAKACQTHRIACGISAESAEAMQKRIKQGFRILGGGGIKGGLTPTADAALRAGRAAAR
jgi:4-hydroxy-2-oxoheptanedioate aldolase